MRSLKDEYDKYELGDDCGGCAGDALTRNRPGKRPMGRLKGENICSDWGVFFRVKKRRITGHVSG